jgi:hypothetical protein
MRLHGAGHIQESPDSERRQVFEVIVGNFTLHHYDRHFVLKNNSRPGSAHVPQLIGCRATCTEHRRSRLRHRRYVVRQRWLNFNHESGQIDH